MKNIIKKIVIASVLFFSYPFFSLATFLKEKKYKNSKKRILIIDNAKIGDLVCVTPVFRAIKEKYPDSFITALVGPRVEGILKNNKYIDEILIYDMNGKKEWRSFIELANKIRKENYSISVNIVSGTLNYILPFVCLIPQRITTFSKINSLFYVCLSYLATDRLEFKKNYLSVRHYLDLLKFINIENNNLKKEVFFTENSKEKVSVFFRKKGISEDNVLVGISLTAGNKIKEWGVENFAKLADLIIKKYNYQVVIISGPSDEIIISKAQKLINNKVIFTYNDFSLEDVPALFNELDYFISVDTGPLYIANALDVPTLDIIGPCSPDDQVPIYEKCEIVFNNSLACRPCTSVLETKIECKEGHLKCTRDLSPNLVLDKFNVLVDKYGK